MQRKEAYQNQDALLVALLAGRLLLITVVAGQLLVDGGHGECVDVVVVIVAIAGVQTR